MKCFSLSAPLGLDAKHLFILPLPLLLWSRLQHGPKSAGPSDVVYPPHHKGPFPVMYFAIPRVDGERNHIEPFWKTCTEACFLPTNLNLNIQATASANSFIAPPPPPGAFTGFSKGGVQQQRPSVQPVQRPAAAAPVRSPKPNLARIPDLSTGQIIMIVECVRRTQGVKAG